MFNILRTYNRNQIHQYSIQTQNNYYTKKADDVDSILRYNSRFKIQNFRLVFTLCFWALS